MPSPQLASHCDAHNEKGQPIQRLRSSISSLLRSCAHRCQQEFGIFFGNVEQAQRRTLWSSNSLLPTLYRFWTDAEKMRERGLTRVQGFPDLTNLVGLHGFWRSRNLHHTQIDLFTALVWLRVSKELPRSSKMLITFFLVLATINLPKASSGPRPSF